MVEECLNEFVVDGNGDECYLDKAKKKVGDEEIDSTPKTREIDLKQ